MKNVLHVEDSEEDAFLFKRAFHHAKLAARLVQVRDGEQAVSYLEGSGTYADREQYPVPDIVLLDIKMPGMSGFDVLKWARRKERYQQLPIFMLSSSNLEEDASEAKALGADGYLFKSLNLGEVVEALRPAIGETPPPLLAQV